MQRAASKGDITEIHHLFTIHAIFLAFPARYAHLRQHDSDLYDRLLMYMDTPLAADWAQYTTSLGSQGGSLGSSEVVAGYR